MLGQDERHEESILSKVQIVSIIDDDESVRAGLGGLVRSLGFAPYAFESAEEFLRSLQIGETSCVITDVHMPGMSGLDLQNRLVIQGRSIPIILITAFPEQSVRERAMAAGAVAYLEKPFDGEAMASLLRRALAAVKLSLH
jgi:FixJ family two-component response regulator